MSRKVFAGIIVCSLIVSADAQAQEVEIPRQTNGEKVRELPNADHESAKKENRTEEASAATVVKSLVREQSQSAQLTIEEMRKAGARAAERLRNEAHVEQANASRATHSQTNRRDASAVRRANPPTRESGSISAQQTNFQTQTAFIKLSDGFDFPIGKPDAQGYYKARGFRSHGHLGEDWDGVRGGDTDLGAPIYSIGDGIVVFARDCHMGWGNVVIVRHAYRERGVTKNIDSFYGHLQKMLVHRGQAVRRGQQIATMGNAHGLYDAHLHLEIRKNIEIGMSRDKFAKDASNYYEPSQFILSHRHLRGGGASYRVAMNTFTQDANIRWDKARNYSHYRGGSSESAIALKKALAAQGTGGR
jgi:murein DD-endopeptidase MepM/ murein hydrolase activator NlpD